MIEQRRRWQWLGQIALLAVVICLAAAAGCGRIRSTRENRGATMLLKRAAEAYADLHSFSEETTIRWRAIYSGKESRQVTRTRFAFRQPNLMYYEKQGDRPLVWVCDGTRLIAYYPETNTYQQGYPPPDLAEFLRVVGFDTEGLSELALLAGGRWEAALTDLRLGKVERVEGASTRAVSGDVASLVGAGETGTEARQTLWIDTKTHMIRRNQVAIRRDDETTQWTETMHKVEVNPDLPDSRFQWSPPPGAKPVPAARPSLPPPQRP